MAVGLQGSADVTVTYDDAPGGTPRVITNFVMNLGAARIQLNTQTSQAFGDLWEEHSPTGTRKSPDIPIGGLFNTTATTGPHVTLRPGDADALPNATPRQLVIVFGDSKTFTVSTRLVDYGVEAKVNALTEFSAVIRPTGAAVWT
jgi:hypothetical protein